MECFLLIKLQCKFFRRYQPSFVSFIDFLEKGKRIKNRFFKLKYICFLVLFDFCYKNIHVSLKKRQILLFMNQYGLKIPLKITKSEI